jgi:uncharacterized membrane protein
LQRYIGKFKEQRVQEYLLLPVILQISCIGLVNVVLEIWTGNLPEALARQLMFKSVIIRMPLSVWIPFSFSLLCTNATDIMHIKHHFFRAMPFCVVVYKSVSLKIPHAWTFQSDDQFTELGIVFYKSLLHIYKCFISADL